MPQSTTNTTSTLDTIESIKNWYIGKSPIKENESWQSNSLTNFPSHPASKILPPLPFEKKIESTSFPLFYIYFGIVLIWSLFFRSNLKTIKSVGQSYISNTALGQILNERTSVNAVVSIIMFMLGLIVISIFGFQASQNIFPYVEENYLHQSKSFIFLIAAFLITLTFVKSIVIWVSSWIFNQPSTFTGYMSLNINSIQILGVVLLPLSILFSYGHHISAIWVTGFGSLLVGLAFIYRISRTFFLAVKETNSQVFHIILYICALEILPLFVVSRVLLG